MHFIIEYKNLIKIKKLLFINTNSSIIDKKVENILISTEKDKLNFYTNNGFTSCKLVLDKDKNKIFKENKLYINAKILLSLIDNLKDHENIEFISRENNLLEVSSQNFSCNLVCVEEQNYLIENYEVDEKYQKITFNFDELKLINNRFKDFCKQLNLSLNKNTLLTNINIKKDNKNNKMYVSTTDSYRIVFGEFNYEGNEFDINISPNSLNNIINLFGDFDLEELNVYCHEDNFVIITDEIIFKSKLYLGKYPNFVDWFNIEPIFSFEINKQKLISALDRNLLFASIYIKTTQCKLTKNKLIVEYKDSDKGFSKEEIEIKNILGDNISFSLNCLYLRQLIKNISANDLIFNLTDPLKPIIIFGKESDKNFKQIILPLKTS